MKPTATLRNARLLSVHDGVVAIGDCFGDTRRRFEDGEPIRTSLVTRVSLQRVTTLNSIYKIENWS